jgi:hypothetical protein
MAQFYLNIRDGDVLTCDPRPYRFATAQAARDAAVQIVRCLLASHPGDHAFDHKKIEISDETGHPIAFVDIDDVRPRKAEFDVRERHMAAH